jgi:hypothetical protein
MLQEFLVVVRGGWTCGFKIGGEKCENFSVGRIVNATVSSLAIVFFLCIH